MTKPSGALSLVAFVEVVKRFSEDQGCQPFCQSCAHWRRRDGAIVGPVGFVGEGPWLEGIRACACAQDTFLV